MRVPISRYVSYNHENKKHARALERSRLLADVIDREQRVIDDGHSILLVDLARIVAGNAEKEAEATAFARRHWWAEAWESLLSLFVLAHSSRQTSQGSRLSPSSENSGKVDVGVDVVGDSAPEKTHVPAASSLTLIRTRLDELQRAEEVRAAKVKGDILAGGEVGEQGPLHFAVAEKHRHSSEAIGRCLNTVEDSRSDPLAWGGKSNPRSKEANPAADNSATASSREGSDSGDGGCRRGTHTPEQEDMGLFLSGLEVSAVQLAAASFEAEVRLLAIGPATPPTAAEVASLPPPPEAKIEQKAPSSPSEDLPPGDLTRSQLDLRRTARVKAFARALNEMLHRGREALQKQTLQVAPPPPRPRVLPPSVDDDDIRC